MAVELPAVLLQFQPESEEVKSRQKYDQAAKAFVKQLDNVSAAHWSKGVDTPQDVLEVIRLNDCSCTRLTLADARPCSQLDSLRLCSPPPHFRRRGQEVHRCRTWRRTMEQAGALPRDVRPGTNALCWARVQEAGRLCRVAGAQCGIGTSSHQLGVSALLTFHSPVSLLRPFAQR